MIQNLLTGFHNRSIIVTMIAAIIIFLIFWLLRKFFTKKLIILIQHYIDGGILGKFVTAFEMPIRALFIVLGLYFALRFLPLSLAADVFIGKLMRTILIILVFWGLYGLAGSHSFLSDELKEKLNLDDILISFFSKVVHILVVALAIVLIANEWGFDINGFVAGLGLGGLAIAFAAKDALANILGGIVIILEKPFAIGDWVATPSVDGIVEGISFRSTRFRTLAQAVVTVPNATLANEAITNWTRMEKRRLTFSLGLSYETPKEKIEICVQKIRTILLENPEINKEQIVVNFEKFNDSSLDVLIYCFTNTTVWTEFIQVREDINLKIMDILEEEGVSIAFPSHSVYLQKQA